MENIILDNITFFDQEHQTNIDVVSINLLDFNERFNTDIYLKYDVSESVFYPTKDSVLSLFFCISINDLLFMAHNPINRKPEDWVDFINWKLEEYQSLITNQERDIFKLRYTDYFPLGLNLKNETEVFIKDSLNTLISKL